MTFISTSAPGKCILFGEHAVVYGHPAVAVAIDQRISIKIQPSTSGMWLLDGGELNMARNPHIKGLIDKLWPVEDGAPPIDPYRRKYSSGFRTGFFGSSFGSLGWCIEARKRQMGGRWRVYCQENWAEGFGSKVSLSDAYGSDSDMIVSNNNKELTLIIGKQAVDADENAILAHSVEAAAQNGRASPMDSSTCSHGGVVVISDQIEADLTHLYRRELTMPDGERFWHIHELDLGKIPEDVYLVIGSTGVNAPTSKQVAKVARMLEQNPARMEEIETIGKIARRGINALMAGDYEAVGRTMTENQIMLKSIGVSSPELDSLIKAAAPSSLGAKLTGAGGGGCMIALTRNPKSTSDAIELAGGRTLISKLGSPGMKIDSQTEITFWTKG